MSNDKELAKARRDRNEAIKEKLAAEKELGEIKEQADVIIEGVKNQEKAFREIKGSWATLFFIPQDLGFEELEKKEVGSPTIHIYHRDGVAITKMRDNKWVIATEAFRMSFTIHSKFEAYIILRAIGMDFSEFL